MRHLLSVLVAVSSTFVAAAQPLPADVRVFVDRREQCEHWRGEYSEDEARIAEINAKACAACLGTDAQLARLRKKYAADAGAKAALAKYEAKIELPSPQAMAKLCKQAQ